MYTRLLQAIQMIQNVLNLYLFQAGGPGIGGILPIMLFMFAVMYFVRTPREEQMMCEFFGQAYRDYTQQTGRLFPRIKVKDDACHHDCR